MRSKRICYYKDFNKFYIIEQSNPYTKKKKNFHNTSFPYQYINLNFEFNYLFKNRLFV